MIKINKKEKIIEFISFSIENFKVKYNIEGEKTANLFYESGVLDFLTEGYDLLHTQSCDYILDEIKLFLENRGYYI